MDALLAHVAAARYTPHRVAIRAQAPHVLASFAFSEIQPFSSADLMRWMTQLVRLIPLGEEGKST
jgi:hypothetical protein